MNTGENKLLQVSWQESKRFIEEHAQQENPRFGAAKLQYHLENYNANRPAGDKILLPDKTVSVSRSETYGVPRQTRSTVQDGRAIFAENQKRHIEKLKKAILNYDSEKGDEKQLIRNYIEYIAIRPKTSKLFMGRMPGPNVCPKKDREILLAIYGHKCVMCGGTKNLQIHHIESLYPSYNRDIENQTLVCETCHCRIHGFK